MDTDKRQASFLLIRVHLFAFVVLEFLEEVTTEKQGIETDQKRGVILLIWVHLCASVVPAF